MMVDHKRTFRLEHCGAALVRMPLLPTHHIHFNKKDPSSGIEEQTEIEYIDSIAKNNAIRQAIWVSSQALDRKLGTDASSSLLSDNDLQKSVAKYVARMSSRCTPFGLMATTGCVGIGNHTVTSRGDSMRLDIEIDDSLLENLRKTIIDHCASVKCEKLRVAANSTWYPVTGRLRYYNHLPQPKGGLHSKIEEVDSTQAIHFALTSARDMITVADLAMEISSKFSVPEKKSVSLIYDLVASGILQTEVHAILTEDANTHRLMEISARVGLSSHPLVRYIADLLQTAKTPEENSNATTLGNLKRYISEVGAPENVELTHVLRVNAFRDSGKEDAPLPNRLVDAIGANLADILALTGEHDPQYAALVESFKKRFGDAEIDLLTAIDPDTGIPGLSFSGLGSSLITDFEFANAVKVSHDLQASAYDKLLLRKLSLLPAGTEEICLEKSDLEQIRAARRRHHPAPPDNKTIAVSGFWNESNSTFSLVGLWTTSALSVLGRFAGGDPSIDDLCKRLSEHEANSESHAKIADIVFTPGGKTTNIVHRKSPLAYEIELNNGKSRFSGSHKIPANELTLHVKHGRFVLRSPSLGHEVIPRLTNAHNMDSPVAPLYRFLGILQRGLLRHALPRPSGALFDWRADVPRVRYKSLVLSPRCWSIDPESVDHLKNLARYERAAYLRELLKKTGCTDRIVRHGQFDVTSHYDLDSDIQCDALVDGLRRGKYARIMEAAPVFSEHCDNTRSDIFVKEFVIPFLVHDDGKHSSALVPSRANFEDALNVKDVVAAPFDGWVFYEIYVGESLADNLIAEKLFPIAEKLQHDGCVENWFFIRYGDDFGPHIRLRFRCNSRRDALKANEMISNALNVFISSGEINSYRISPYERELRRYGGKRGLPICEDLFWINSEFVARMLSSRDEASGINPHWLWHLWWVYTMLEDFGFKKEESTSFLRERFASMRYEMLNTSEVGALLSETVRKDFVMIRSKLEAAGHEAKATGWVQALIDKRRTAIEKLLSEVGTAASRNILISLIHMDTNRFFNAQQRHHELVMYGVLSKYTAYRCNRK